MDLPSYDFISLFQMLPLPREGYINADKNGVAIRSYLAAAVCGSHFTRLYSQNSLHFRHYSVSLHGISVRIPILHVQMLIETEIRSEENGCFWEGLLWHSSLVDDPVADDCDPDPFINLMIQSMNHMIQSMIEAGAFLSFRDRTAAVDRLNQSKEKSKKKKKSNRLDLANAVLLPNSYKPLQ
ncbi:uncharacterized protein LOC131064661 [Cryptomeria japonica]|uniref:uncharacterized protein LOC131064661 n=1 Tax=Cryptomeria japonica TaxID=3369 RepID=UPI0027DA945E|nr:uncharacterized protein LOC131064661 [Cryptomeria japonica]